MVSQDRFLEGLFAPHGGLALDTPRRGPLDARWPFGSLWEWAFGAQEPRQSDFALCGPSKC